MPNGDGFIPLVGTFDANAETLSQELRRLGNGSIRHFSLAKDLPVYKDVDGCLKHARQVLSDPEYCGKRSKISPNFVKDQEYVLDHRVPLFARGIRRL